MLSDLYRKGHVKKGKGEDFKITHSESTIKDLIRQSLHDLKYPGAR